MKPTTVSYAVVLRMPEIGDFPFLSSAEFEQACKSLIKRLSTSSLEAALKEEVCTVPEYSLI